MEELNNFAIFSTSSEIWSKHLRQVTLMENNSAPKRITMHVNSGTGEEINVIINISAPKCIASHVNSGVDVGVGWIEKIN